MIYRAESVTRLSHVAGMPADDHRHMWTLIGRSHHSAVTPKQARTRQSTSQIRGFNSSKRVGVTPYAVIARLEQPSAFSLSLSLSPVIASRRSVRSSSAAVSSRAN